MSVSLYSGHTLQIASVAMSPGTTQIAWAGAAINLKAIKGGT